MVYSTIILESTTFTHIRAWAEVVGLRITTHIRRLKLVEPALTRGHPSLCENPKANSILISLLTRFGESAYTLKTLHGNVAFRRLDIRLKNVGAYLDTMQAVHGKLIVTPEDIGWVYTVFRFPFKLGGR